MTYYTHKMYDTDIHYNDKTNLYEGKILDIKDKITFAGETFEEAVSWFIVAVDDYIDYLNKDTDSKLLQ